MRLRITRDGKPVEVAVAPDLTSVEVAGRSYPAKVVKASALRVELEIGEEKVVVENWPDHFPEPPGPVDVNGERGTVGVERLSVGAFSPPPTSSPTAPHPSTPEAIPAPDTSGATAVLPPMPGKVIEVRVKEGDAVEAGDVLLVLEAMKMRNEVTSPIRGTVRSLRVTAGSNARAREPMVLLDPR
jgi:biotin carboxyl carrier protein